MNAEVLLTVPNAELHKVEHGVQTRLATGDFSVQFTCGPPESQQLVQASVGQVSWPLGKHLPALKAAATIYSFGLEGTRSLYYCLLLPQNTEPLVLDAVSDVIASACASSTVRQVDAAFEEADKLTGGAAAAAAQQQATTAPPTAAPQPYPFAAAPAGALQPYPPPAVPGALERPPGQPPGAATPALPPSSNPTADRVAGAILAGGTILAGVVGKAAGGAASALRNHLEQRRAREQPAVQPARISPQFRQGLQVAGSVASGAAYVTGSLATLLGNASYCLALRLSKMLTGSQPAVTARSGDTVTPEQRSAMKTIGAAGLLAYVEVYDALEKAATTVLMDSADAGQQYIAYKYGSEAAAVAADSVPVAHDMLRATLNTSRLGARAFVSGTAKRAAKMYLKHELAGLHPDLQAAGHRVPPGRPVPVGAGGGAAAAPAPYAALTGVR